MTKKIFLILIILIGLFLNNLAFAALVTCDPALPAGPGSCDLCALFETIQNVVNFLIGLAFSIVTIMLVYGGIRMYFSGDNPNNRKTAVNVVINAVIGLVIVLTSWVIINTVITFLAKPGSAPTFWTQINCTSSELVGESEKPEKPEKCVENEKKCDGSTVIKCINGEWKEEEVCTAIGVVLRTCENGECVFLESGCQYQRPNDPYRYACRDKCENGETPTSYICDIASEVLQVCCKSAQPVICTDGQTRCSTDASKCTNQTEAGRFEEICVNNSWQFNQCCEEGCGPLYTGSGSICHHSQVTIGSPMEEGNPCANIGETYCINSFIGGYLLKCNESSVWEKIDCPGLCGCRDNNYECKVPSPIICN